MSKATLPQARKLLELIAINHVSEKQLQQLFESGLLTDLIVANVSKVDRATFIRVLGGPVYCDFQFRELDESYHENCLMKKNGCKHAATQEAHCSYPQYPSGGSIAIPCCTNSKCKNAAQETAQGNATEMAE